MNKLISIIIPAYNVEKYIGEALESILHQDLDDCELIIVNDGSNDKTSEIINKYKLIYPNIIIINQENQGLSAARKKGFDNSHGEYIYFMDGDDILEYDAISIMKKSINSKKDCYVFNAKFKNELTNDWGISMDKKSVISKYYKNVENGIDFLNQMINNHEWRYAVWLYLIKREIIENNVTFFKNYFHEDSAFNYQILNASTSIEVNNIIIYNYRLRENSLMSMEVTSKNIASYLNSFKIIHNTNKSLNNPNKKKFEIRIIDQIIEVLLELSYEELVNSFLLIEELSNIIKKENYYDNNNIKDFFKTDKFTFEFLEGKVRRKRRSEVADRISYLEIHLVDHCNLNCKGCCHFSPIAEKFELNITDFEKDIKRLSELIHGKLDRLILLGGEPLLNHNINEIIKIARYYFPNTEIQILTNGILLLKESADFFLTCKTNNIQINITEYPINFDYDKAIKVIDNYGLDYFIYDSLNQNNKKFDMYCFDLNKGQDANKNFYESCVMAKDCAYLEHGKIYPCQLAANIRHLNAYFHTDFEQLESDYIDIYSDIKEEDIYKFLAHPIEFCKYCNFSKHKRFTWDFSQKSIDEWEINEKNKQLKLTK